jgi:hypothetical protein
MTDTGSKASGSCSRPVSNTRMHPTTPGGVGERRVVRARNEIGGGGGCAASGVAGDARSVSALRKQYNVR